MEPRIALSTIEVTSLLDVGNPSGTTSLRQAIGQANAAPGSVIEFDANLFSSGSGTIALESALPALGANVTISGPGLGTLTIQGGGPTSDFSPFTVDAGVTATISGVTISGGQTSDRGGAILNSGTLIVSDASITGNAATGYGGGGIFNQLGTVTLTNTTLSNNSSRNGGGGLFNNQGTMTLTGCAVSGNTSGGGGAGIFDNVGMLTLTRSTLSGNTATGSGGAVGTYKGTVEVTASTLTQNSGNYGGALSITGGLTLTDSTVDGNSAKIGGGLIASGTSTISGSNFSRNSSSVYGGGIDNDGVMTLTNSTLSGNTSQLGAGILNHKTLTLINATIAANRAYGSPSGGIFTTTPITLFNTLIAGNFTGPFGSTTPGDIVGAAEPASANNLIGDGDNLTGISDGSQGNLIGTAASPIDAKLGTLADNGGPTATIALLAGSPAIDAGAATISGVTIPNFDQRHAQRGPAGLNAGNTADIGAYEATSSYLVTSTADDGSATGTLRAAIAWANTSNLNANPANIAAPAPNTVRFDTAGTFATPQTIALTSRLSLTSTTTPEVINGPGSSRLTLQGGGPTSGFGIFTVGPGVTATLFGLKITGGNSNVGGGIINQGNLTLTSSVVSGNNATSGGGGIYNHGTMALVDTTVSGNTAHYGGGGIINYPSSSTLTLTNSIVSGNHAGASGAGIQNFGTLTVTGSVITENSTTDNGGGILNGGTLNLTGSTLSGNHADDKGGAIWTNGGTTIADSTLTGNDTSYGGAIYSYGTVNLIGVTLDSNRATVHGGGIVNQGSLTLTNSTLYGNTARNGGGIFNRSTGTLTLTNATLTANRSTGDPGGGIEVEGGTVTLNNTLVAGNVTGDTGVTPGDILGAVASASAFNLVGDGDDLTGISNNSQGNKIGTAASPIDAKLGPLADNGGATKTVALLAGSPAFAAGSVPLAVDPSTGDPLPFDQRGPGFPRTVNGAVDIGAFEVQSVGTTLAVAAATGTYGGTTTLTATLTSGGAPISGQLVDFHLGATDLGTATTDTNGVATLAGVPLGTLGAGTYVDDVTAAFAGSAGFLPSDGSATLTVAKAVLTVTADDLTKVYGADLPPLTYTITGFVNGDGPSVVSGVPVLTTTATSASHVAGSPYAIDVQVGTLSADNYDFSDLVDGALTVTPAPLTVTANHQTKVYGAAPPTLTYTITGFVNGDGPSVVSGAPVLTTTATASSHVAGSPYAIDIEVGTLSASDYTFSTLVDGTLDVTPAPLTVTANDQTKVYGAALPTLTYTITGFVNGDSSSVVQGAPVLTTTATAASHVAGNPYPINVAIGTLKAADYTFPNLKSGALLVTKAPLTVTANNTSKVYGAPVPTLTATLSGFVNGDTSAVVSGSPALTTTATAASHVAGNPYPINVAVGALSAADYRFADFVPGTLDVTPAPLTIAANAVSVPFGGAIPTLTASFIGLVNGDTPASLATPPTLSTTATSNSPAGAYPIVASGASSSDYTISYAGNTLTVEPFVPPATPSGRAATGFLTTLYEQVLNRGPEPLGLRYWLGRYRSLGQPRIARAFGTSPERRGLEQSGHAPTIPLNVAYANAVRAARQAAIGSLGHPTGLSALRMRPRHR